MNKIVVSLREFVGELEAASGESHAYLNKLTGEFVMISDDDIFLLENGEDISDEPEWQQEVLQKAREVQDSEDYLALPGQRDLHEYSIMESFSKTIQDMHLRETLLYRIKGSGAFRQFREAIRKFNVEDDWYRYKEQALQKIATEWLEEHGIDYKDDM